MKYTGAVSLIERLKKCMSVWKQNRALVCDLDSIEKRYSYNLNLRARYVLCGSRKQSKGDSLESPADKLC